MSQIANLQIAVSVVERLRDAGIGSTLETYVPGRSLGAQGGPQGAWYRVEIEKWFSGPIDALHRIAEGTGTRVSVINSRLVFVDEGTQPRPSASAGEVRPEDAVRP